MKEDLFKDIIAKFLEGKATAHEKEMLSNWLKQDASREENFYFQLSKRENECPQYLPEMESKITAYEAYLNGGDRMVAMKPSNADQVAPRSTTYKWWSVAASVILFVCAGYYFLGDSLIYQRFSAENGMINTVTLEDGSIVTLNANSSIQVRRDFMDHENREVWIQGEAFFEVRRKHDLMKFIVHTKNFDVEVLGTKFNINNRHGKTEVMLAEGKVKLVSKGQKPLIMEPGEKVTLADNQEHFEKQIVNPKRYEAWRNNMLVFENTPLTEVARTIQDYYGVEVKVSDSLLATRQFTGTLPNNDLDVILLALGTAYNIEFERKGDQIILR